MIEDKKGHGPTKCHNCGSENIIGPYRFGGAAIRIRFFELAETRAYVCIDCYHTMLFIRIEHEHKISKESARIQSKYQ